MFLLKIKSKYQVTLPVNIRKKLGWNIDDQVNAYIKQDRIVIKKISSTDDGAIPISIRLRFQFTLPVEIYSKFHIYMGDMLEAYVENNDSLILIPKILLVKYHLPEAEEEPTLPQKNDEFRAYNLESLSKKNRRSRKIQGARIL